MLPATVPFMLQSYSHDQAKARLQMNPHKGTVGSFVLIQQQTIFVMVMYKTS